METTKVLTKEEIQAALEERHSPEKQKKLSEGRVTIAGLGGLGSNVAYALARIGVGHLHLMILMWWILRILNPAAVFYRTYRYVQNRCFKVSASKDQSVYRYSDGLHQSDRRESDFTFENAGIICKHLTIRRQKPCL